MYTGTMIDDLFVRVSNALDLAKRSKPSWQISAEELAHQDIENAKLCANCRESLGDHSHEHLHCPIPFDAPLGTMPITKFAELCCQAEIVYGAADAYKCSKRCVPGTEFCKEHTEE